MVAVSFSIDLGSGGGDFHVCIPYAMLEPIRNLIYSGVQADRSETDDRWTSLLSAHVYDAEVQLQATLATATVTLGQLMSLQPGDVIALDLPESIGAQVDGVPVMQGRYGVVNGRYALKVERPLGSPGGDG